MFKYLTSNNLKFELVTEEDAEFILELRKNQNLNQYISKTEISVEDQKKWIKNYKKKESDGTEYYFRIDKKGGEQLGFVRVYNIDYINKTFTWGSWIIKEGRPVYSAIESALIVYEFAFYDLKMEKAVFEVMKENKGVIKFHKRFGAVETSEDEIYEYFEIPLETYESLKIKKYNKYILEK